MTAPGTLRPMNQNLLRCSWLPHGKIQSLGGPLRARRSKLPPPQTACLQGKGRRATHRRRHPLHLRSTHRCLALLLLLQLLQLPPLLQTPSPPSLLNSRLLLEGVQAHRLAVQHGLPSGDYGCPRAHVMQQQHPRERTRGRLRRRKQGRLAQTLLLP